MCEIFYKLLFWLARGLVSGPVVGVKVESNVEAALGKIDCEFRKNSRCHISRPSTIKYEIYDLNSRDVLSKNKQRCNIRIMRYCNTFY